VIVKRDVVAILDEARNGRYEKLHVLLSMFVRNTDQNKAEIVSESLFTISKKFATGDPSIVLAPQLSGIVRNHSRRVYEREEKATAALVPGGDAELERYALDEASDPAKVIEKAELVEEQIVRLRKMKENQPRQFAILMARHQGIPDGEFLKSQGEDISNEALRQLRARAKKTSAKTMQQTRKGPQP